MGDTKFGTDPYILARTSDPDTSHAAAGVVNTTHLEQMVYNAIRSYGAVGCISDQLLAQFASYPYSSITARYKALKTKKLITVIGKRQGKSGRNQSIMRVVV